MEKSTDVDWGRLPRAQRSVCLDARKIFAICSDYYFYVDDKHSLAQVAVLKTESQRVIMGDLRDSVF